jgi:hypothetical protein
VASTEVDSPRAPIHYIARGGSIEQPHLDHVEHFAMVVHDSADGDCFPCSQRTADLFLSKVAMKKAAFCSSSRGRSPLPEMSHEDSLALSVRCLVQLKSGVRGHYDRCLRLVLKEPEDMPRAISLRARAVHVSLRVVTEQAQTRIFAARLTHPRSAQGVRLRHRTSLYQLRQVALCPPWRISDAMLR